MAKDEEILAIIVTSDAASRVRVGSGPLFLTADEPERQRLGQLLSNILDAMVHDLENGVSVLVRH